MHSSGNGGGNNYWTHWQFDFVSGNRYMTATNQALVCHTEKPINNSTRQQHRNNKTLRVCGFTSNRIMVECSFSKCTDLPIKQRACRVCVRTNAPKPIPTIENRSSDYYANVSVWSYHQSDWNHQSSLVCFGARSPIHWAAVCLLHIGHG